MRVDFFELIEGLFRGVVYFFYNLVETIYILLRYPRRGPARLYRIYKRKDRQQLGGLTLLFTLLFILFAGAAIADNRVDVRSTLSAPLSGRFGWESILCALASTVAIDAAARLFLRFRYKQNSRKREIALTLFEYALVWPMVILAGWYIYIFFNQTDGVLPDWSLGLVMIFAGLFSFLPAARILFISRRRQGLRRWLFAFVRCAQTIVLLTYFAIALTQADQLRNALYRTHYAPTVLKMKYFRCMIGTAHPYLDVVVDNPSDEGVTLDVRRDWALAVLPKGAARAKSRIYRLMLEDGADSMPLRLPVGASQVIRLYPVDRPIWQPGDNCRLLNREGQVSLDAYWSGVETGAEELGPVYWPDEGVNSFYDK